MALPPRPESWKAGAGPDDDAANAGNTNTAVSASFANPFAILLSLCVPT